MVRIPFQQMAEVAPPAGAARGAGGCAGGYCDFSKSEPFWGAEFGKSAVKPFRNGKALPKRPKNVKKHLFV
jgi:hypothetical protein